VSILSSSLTRSHSPKPTSEESYLERDHQANMEENTEIDPADEDKIYLVFETTCVYALFQDCRLLGDRELEQNG
jgi:hypothetical protein